ncbi:hypothetical protein ABVT39_013270 [Epinephelus coioides]
MPGGSWLCSGQFEETSQNHHQPSWEVLSSVFAHNPTCTAVSFLAKGKRRKLVLLLSTRHRQAEIADDPHRKPVMILDYNSLSSRAPFARAYVEAVKGQAAATAAAGSSVEPDEGERERGSRMQCSLCPPRATTGKRQKRVTTRCCSCGKPICKDHSFFLSKDCSS